jgi:hypothetical protein
MRGPNSSPQQQGANRDEMDRERTGYPARADLW